MHVYDKPAQIQDLTFSYHETTEARVAALGIDARTDCGRAAADVDLLDDVGARLDGEDARRAILVGTAEHPLPVAGDRAPDGKIIVVVSPALAPVDSPKEHTADMGDVAN
jgi:hypothetical protein